MRYAEGRGVEKDAEKARELYSKTAEQGHEEAQQVVDLLDSDVQVLADTSESSQSQRKIKITPPPSPGVKSQPTGDQASVGMPEQVNTPLQSFSTVETPETLYNLAKKYAEGIEVEQDAEKACELYRKAADQGHTGAQYNLGWMYVDGRGVAQSDTEGVAWFRKAAAQGHAGAQQVVDLLDSDVQVLADTSESSQSQPKIKITPPPSPGVKSQPTVAQASVGMPERVNTPLQSFSTVETPETLYNLAKKYAEGIEVEQDFTQALRLYTRAAQQGHSEAQVSLGILYDRWSGVGEDNLKNDTHAVVWYTQAADQGHADAQANLGLMYCYGRGVTRDKVKAVELYQLSAKQGCAQGQFLLGDMYEKGLGGLSKDTSKASELY